MVASSKIAELIKLRQDKFVETRTQIELELNKFLDSISKSSEDIRRRCQYREGVSARTLLPALWEEPFDMEKYKQQRAAVDAYVEGVTKIFNAINEEALRCLQS